ncbi:MAG TPA: hypothetical protein VFY71_00320 [Planctomycetota bacterium]|nr:hypothetical protein [Planctomycetota bacterium]
MHEPTRAERSGAPWGAVALLAGLAGGLLGAGATWALAARAERAAAPASVRDEALAGQVAELSRRIEALNQALARPAATDAEPSDGAAVPPAIDAAGLHTALDALTSALREMAVQSDSSAAPKLVIPPADPLRRNSLETQIGRDIQAMRDRHLFWTDQELLDAYGPPDFVAVQDGVEQWTYAFPAGSAAFAMHLRRVFDVFSD